MVTEHLLTLLAAIAGPLAMTLLRPVRPPRDEPPAPLPSARVVRR
jgi:hypothetical protein